MLVIALVHLSHDDVWQLHKTHFLHYVEKYFTRIIHDKYLLNQWSTFSDLQVEVSFPRSQSLVQTLLLLFSAVGYESQHRTNCHQRLVQLVGEQAQREPAVLSSAAGALMEARPPPSSRELAGEPCGQHESAGWSLARHTAVSGQSPG